MHISPINKNIISSFNQVFCTKNKYLCFLVFMTVDLMNLLTPLCTVVDITARLSAQNKKEL